MIFQLHFNPNTFVFLFYRWVQVFISDVKVIMIIIVIFTFFT